MAEKNIAKTDSEQLLPFSLTLFDEIYRVFNEYFNRNWSRSFLANNTRLDDLWGTYEMHTPGMGMINKDNKVTFRAELPGIDKKDMDCECFRSEIRKGSFCRSVSLPNNIDSSKIKANVTNDSM